ncbi:hypothetical protein F4703DRAFT_1913613 [Phycomyces blakesleeanus]|uniref:Uncharacterized protein n=1 Tax=Phycomyces blakesleeanus (strain ATCC 8743b / DSM 1359 / FGSC 10004 / NBRC 33097 / NRRL 1555) TaxID=763407 RepID=A0A167PQR4_PHYB8|nr:hypothetical protein PHYBLDRAFT_163486 [Phycomyces blakesleeanus NRRL 1555(-)]OAD78366.1 hypothetical protein PHYBLDRAFT_163486 [Phycomyces blakesleeanus NRRL 1555(-)]|eukprot:XP_018296406.1 hypothetical protein PHYBLDRAFT_163486 [Phycomyces blakesleeanus NRRL 1555(-)]
MAKYPYKPYCLLSHFIMLAFWTYFHVVPRSVLLVNLFHCVAFYCIYIHNSTDPPGCTTIFSDVVQTTSMSVYLERNRSLGALIDILAKLKLNSRIKMQDVVLYDPNSDP